MIALGRCLASAGVMAALDDHSRCLRWPVSFDRTWSLLGARDAARRAMVARPRARGHRGPRVWWRAAHDLLDAAL